MNFAEGVSEEGGRTQLHRLPCKTLRLCLVLGKFEGKCEGKKIQRKSRRKKKVKENKKNRLKVNKLFFLLLQTHFIYFNSSI